MSVRIRRSTVGLSLLLLILIPVFRYNLGEKNCFIALEDGKIIYQEGDCFKRNSPYCTFNIVLSLIGFDTGVLIDEYNPVWPYYEGYVDWFDSWKQDHNPKLWRKNSCVWYSRVLTYQIGFEVLQQYVDMMSYGNRDISGDFGLDNSLTQSWIESSLEITPYEQVLFIDKMLAHHFPISEHAYDMTKRILYNNIMDNGWKLYGKVGSGQQWSKDKKSKLITQSGWFTGWIEKEDRKIIFAMLKEEGHIMHRELVFTRARSDTIQKLYKIIDIKSDHA